MKEASCIIQELETAINAALDVPGNWHKCKEDLLCIQEGIEGMF